MVTVCGMNRRKGIDDLIRAFELVQADVPCANLYLVGDGPDRQEFEQQARQSRCPERIHFEGYQAQPQAYMLSADAFVLASRRESFGLVLIEARQAGCPIVATDVDGIAEALDGGRAGLLVPKENAAALAAALYRLLSNAAEQAEWRNRARDGIGAFQIDQMASEISNIYEELLREKRPRAVSNLSAAGGYASPIRTRSLPPAADRESRAARS
ncbi:MAG: glycosyltransferase [Terracidiphilus sp.]